MEQRSITVTFNEAKKWYNSGNTNLKRIALRAFYEKDLKDFDFTEVKTFDNALDALDYSGYDKGKIHNHINAISLYSKASAAMFKLNIIRKALNKKYDMHLTKDSDGQNYIWYPYFRFITKDCTYYDSDLEDGTLKKIGRITSEGITYDILYGSASNGSNTGLGLFNFNNGVGVVIADLGFFGCATKEIAEYFGKHFWMFIIEAMYGDMIDFHIMER